MHIPAVADLLIRQRPPYPSLNTQSDMCRRTDYQFPCSHIESRVELCSYRCYLARHSDPRNHHSCEVEMEPFEKPHVDVTLFFKRSVAWVGAGLGVRRKQTVVERLRIRYEEECDECCL